jgi:hypothetical protein
VVLEEPCAMAVSPSGEKIAISDRRLRNVLVIDLYGRLLWSRGIENLTVPPGAISFADERGLLVALEGKPIVIHLQQDRASIIDTVVDLSRSFHCEVHFSAIAWQGESGFVVLDDKNGRILQFDRLWNYGGVLVPHGSGRGRVLVPSSVTCANTGRFAVTDRKNIPVQAFSHEGQPLYAVGWNQPLWERHWEGAAAAFDIRGILWVADDTNSLFRLYDPSGILLSSFSYDDRMYRPIAMSATPDHRVAVLDQTGWLFFYAVD